MDGNLTQLCLAFCVTRITENPNDEMMREIIYRMLNQERPLADELQRGIILRMTPLTLVQFENLWSSVPIDIQTDKRPEAMDIAWNNLHVRRWGDEPGIRDFRAYCERHFAECLEVTQNSSANALIGETRIPGNILNYIGYQQHMGQSLSRFSGQCTFFGPHIRNLTISDPRIFLAACILKCAHLDRLETTWRRITMDEVKGFSKFLRRNKRLKTISFIDFRVSEPKRRLIFEALPSIEHLAIQGSDFRLGLELFSELLNRAQKLVSLSLRGCKLKYESAAFIWDSAANSPSDIEALDFSENNLAGFICHIAAPAAAHHAIRHLKILNLSDAQLNLEDVKLLASLLPRLSVLEDLNLSYNYIGNRLRFLQGYFSVPNSVTKLKLDGCELKRKTVCSFLQHLSQNKKVLDMISLGENIIGKKFGLQLGMFLCSGVKELHLPNCGLTDEEFLNAATRIGPNIKISYMNLMGNAIGDGAREFMEAVRAHSLGEVKFDT